MSEEKNPGPYVRRRAFSKVHVTSWLIYLERDGFVRCSFQNCNFLAFDVEEMCNHYGLCNGDCSSTAQFVCENCGGRTVSLKKLQLHKARAHNISIPETSEVETKPQLNDVEQPVKPSRVLLASWSYFFDKHNYIKCSSCNYLANTLMEMGRHYSRCKKEVDLLLYVCPECKGRTMNVNPLLWHMERCHKIFKAPSQFNHITTTMVRFWEREIIDKGHTSCLHIYKGKRDCSYFDFDILGIIEHSQTCKGPKVFTMAKEQCLVCPKWTNTAEKLNQHVKMCHQGNMEVVEEKPLNVVRMMGSAVGDGASEDCDRISSDELSCHSTSGDHMPNRGETSTASDGIKTDEVSVKTEDEHLLSRLMNNQEMEVAASENQDVSTDVAVQREECVSDSSIKNVINVSKPSSSRSEMEMCIQKNNNQNRQISNDRNIVTRKTNQSINAKNTLFREEENEEKSVKFTLKKKTSEHRRTRENYYSR